MIVTARARWLIVLSCIAAVIGLWRLHATVVQLAVAVLLWLGFEWILFRARVDGLRRGLRAKREIHSRQGIARTLWESRTVEVRTNLRCDDPGIVWRTLNRVLSPVVTYVHDMLPTVVEELDGNTGAAFSFGDTGEVNFAYRIRPRAPGVAKYHGLRLVMHDLHGFFHAERFVALPAEYRVLPLAIDAGAASAVRKQINALPPPGIHTMSRPGVGSELLEIRDYVPGDAPRSIAWKVSARRDELMTKQFESEVPVRCQMFVDMSRSMRLGYPGHCMGGRMVSLAATIASSLASQRDPVGMSVFDGQRVSITRATASRKAVIRMVDSLAGRLAVPIEPVDVPFKGVLRSAFDIARILYPEAIQMAEQSIVAWIARPSTLMRRRMAAVLCNHYQLDPLAMGELSDNDRQMSHWLQRFCAEHGAPWTTSLFDADGRYLFDDQEKVGQLAKLIRNAASRSRDSELFVVLAELTDTEYDLQPLLQAIKFAKARQHRVVMLLAWPAKMPAPESNVSLDQALQDPAGINEHLVEWCVKESTFARLKGELARLRVPVAVAADKSATTLIMNQLEVVRSGRVIGYAGGRA